MAWSTGTIAEAYRLALVDGVVGPETIDTWLDSLIAAADVPSPELIDASLAACCSVASLVTALEPLALGYDTEFAIKGYFRLAAIWLERDTTPVRTVTRSLEQLALAGQAPDGCAHEMLRLDDAMSLARGGVRGSEGAVREELMTFLVHEGAWPEA